MTVVFIALIVFAIGGLTLLLTRHSRAETKACTTTSCASCVSGNDCIARRLLQANTQKPEYYDDEELDAFRGRPSDQYTDEEAAQFSYVAETMRTEEIDGWLHSLTMRGIALPAQVKTEIVALMR